MGALGARDERRGGMALEAVESREKPRIEHYDVTDASVTTTVSRDQQTTLDTSQRMGISCSINRNSYTEYIALLLEPSLET